MKILIALSIIFISATLYCRKQCDCLINQPAPLFRAPAVFPDGSVHDLALQDYIGKKVVLYFYPMDQTPGCSAQARSFCQNAQLLQDNDIHVIGISCDSINAHKKFQKKYDIWYPLVSDSRWKRTISKMYDAAGLWYSKRKTFIIDEQGIVIKVFSHVTIDQQINDIIKSYQIK